jgi:hypothetical protein
LIHLTGILPSLVPRLLLISQSLTSLFVFSTLTPFSCPAPTRGSINL